MYKTMRHAPGSLHRRVSLTIVKKARKKVTVKLLDVNSRQERDSSEEITLARISCVCNFLSVEEKKERRTIDPQLCA